MEKGKAINRKIQHVHRSLVKHEGKKLQIRDDKKDKRFQIEIRKKAGDIKVEIEYKIKRDNVKVGKKWYNRLITTG